MFYIFYHQTAELKRSKTLVIGDDLKGSDLAKMLVDEKTLLYNQQEEDKKEVKDELKNITETFTTLMASQNQRLAALETKLQAIIDSGFLVFWPAGRYALLEPETGCPSDGANTWKKGAVHHHTESTDRNQDTLSEGNHLKMPVLSREMSDNFITQRFCVKTTGHTAGPTWPKGSYCVNKKGRHCPMGFKQGFVYFDEENTSNTSNKGNNSGVLPEGIYSDDTQMFYCCREDGSHSVAIYLPTSTPFYLYRKGGQCQAVHGMSVTPEFLVLDTENTDNKDITGGEALPDVTVNNVRLELCYYELA